MKDFNLKFQRGISLVELMISMTIGLVMVGAILTAFISDIITTRATIATAKIQESARFGYEYMARDLREAAGTPCGSERIANVLNTGGAAWMADLDQSTIKGYDGGEALIDIATVSSGDTNVTAKRIPGSDALALTVVSGQYFSIDSHQALSAEFEISEANHGLKIGDIVFVCDYSQGSIFQITDSNTANKTVMHDVGSGVVTPGNCTKGLGFPTLCTTNGTLKAYDQNSIIAKVQRVYWYLGCNGFTDCSLPDGRSLYFTYLNGGSLVKEALVDNVTDMQITYLERTSNNYQVATSISNWNSVTALRIELTTGQDSVGVGSSLQDIRRKFSYVVALRSRL